MQTGNCQLLGPPKALPQVHPAETQDQLGHFQHRTLAAGRAESPPINVEKPQAVSPCSAIATTGTDGSVKLQPASLNLTHSKNYTVRYSLKCRELDLHMKDYLNRVSVF